MYESDKFISKTLNFYNRNPQERQKTLDEAIAECKSKNSQLIGFHELIENLKLRKRR